MAGELVPLSEQIQKQDSGSFDVDPYQLMRMSNGESLQAEQALRTLVKANPDYEFMIEDIPFTGGIRISWRKRKDVVFVHRSEEESSQ